MKKFFSLTEIIVVLVLVGLILSIVIGNVIKSTDAQIIDNQSILKDAFSTATLNAQISNSIVELELKQNDADLSINITYPKEFKNNLHRVWRGKTSYLLKDTKISENHTYKFFPNGEGSGKQTQIFFFDKEHIINIDRLTSKLFIESSL